MVLSDKSIKKLGESLITSNYDESRVGSMSYDLETEWFIKPPNIQLPKVTLAPMESVFVKPKDTICLPPDLTAMVILRNSRIRQGLSLDAPMYQPGHSTPPYFRITNLTGQEMELDKRNGFASLVFFKLDYPAEKPYEGTFQDEIDFRYLADYSSVLGEELKETSDKLERLQGAEHRIYGNVMQLIAIFIGIFSLINVNISSVLACATSKTFIVLNMVMIASIAALIGLVGAVLPSSGKKGSFAPWIVSAVAFVIALIAHLSLS